MTLESVRPLWKHQELLSALGLGHSTSFVPAGPIMGVSMDTRTLKRDDLFVALRGQRCDGHDLLDHAFSCGAVGAIVDQKIYADPRVICVSDARKA